MSMYAKVWRLRLREGLSISEIARRTSLSRNTIKTWLRAP
ncbi:MAG: helix-turn-helix domain-containing protein [Xanthomonadales bacterium]|nr:helix-turn-helix domain-containing protein [Xanthomonadales bacterium]